MAKNVLIIHHSSKLDGSFISLLSFLKTLPKEKIKPIVLLPKKERAYHELKKLNIETEIIPQGYLVYNTSEKISPFNLSAWTKISPSLNPFHFIRLFRLIKKKKINLVHLNSSSLIFTGLAIKALNIPLVWHIREKLPRGILTPFLACLIKRLSDKIIAVSQDEAWPFKKSKKLHIIYNPVDEELFDQVYLNNKEKIKKKLKLPLSSPLVGFIGRIHKTSGIFDLIKASQQVKNKIPEVKFVIIGRIFSPSEIKKQKFKLILKKILRLPKGQLEYYLKMKKLIKKNKLESNFIFLGFQEEIAQAIQTLDIVVCPTHLGNPSRIPLEAGFLGKPVILTTNSPKSEIVLNEQTGIVLPPQKPNLLAKAIIDLMKNEDKRKKMGEEARKRAKKLFANKKIGQDILKIYQQVLK